MEHKVILTPLARRDLKRIQTYIAKNDWDRASAFCLELAEQASSLKIFPDRCLEVTSRPGIRKIPYGSYLIYYRVNESTRTVEILRFWHGAKDQQRLRLKEEAALYAADKASAS